MIGKWGFSLLPFYLGIIPIFANNNYTLTLETIINMKMVCRKGACRDFICATMGNNEKMRRDHIRPYQ